MEPLPLPLVEEEEEEEEEATAVSLNGGNMRSCVTTGSHVVQATSSRGRYGGTEPSFRFNLTFRTGWGWHCVCVCVRACVFGGGGTEEGKGSMSATLREKTLQNYS